MQDYLYPLIVSKLFQVLTNPLLPKDIFKNILFVFRHIVMNKIFLICKLLQNECIKDPPNFSPFTHCFTNSVHSDET